MSEPTRFSTTDLEGVGAFLARNEARDRELATRAAADAARRSADNAAANFTAARCPDRHVAALGPDLVANRQWAAYLERLLSSVCHGGGTWALLGDRGTGKTQLATALLRKAAWHCTGRYCKALDLFRDIRATFDGGNEREVVGRLARVGVLVIDEIHQRGQSEWERNVLANLVDRRYDGRRTTVLIGNLTVAAFAEVVGDSIVSRMVETGGALVCDWPSYRQDVKP
jgi:DNA replication protein DnaC